jgi:SAM-dependent methyltransferase
MDYKDLQAEQTKEHFWFRAKNDLVGVLMNKACQGKSGLRILNIGAGTGDDLGILNQFGANYVVDTNKDALDLISNALCAEKKQADACQLPYGDGFFDAVVAFDVFEHIEDDRQAADEIRRVLKPGGALVFTVPAFPFLYSSHDRALGHFRRYDKSGAEKLLAGFDHARFFYWNSLLFPLLAATRIMNKRSKPQVERAGLPAWLNFLFYNTILVDNFFIGKNISPLFGSSIVGFGYKHKE